jgi:putative hydrolase of the HAD superfamily
MKSIILDMYGVMLEESMGNFKPYTYNHFPNTDINLFRDKYLEAEAGVINSAQLFEVLGFENPRYHMKNYIENHLTIDKGFVRFAEKYHGRYTFALISNGISQWHKHIMNYYDFDKYFEVEVVSADIGCRKPNPYIYEVLMKQLDCQH